MGAVDDYLASLPPGGARSELGRLHRMICAQIPDVGQTTSYAMAAYTYRGMPVAAVVARKHHLAWYPFSSAVLQQVRDDLAGYSHSAGTLRFAPDTPLPDHLVVQLLDIRMGQIDERLEVG